MVSSKFCDDVCYDNQSYAQILGISLELINQLEVAFLFSINWNLVLEEGEFEDTLEIIYNKRYGLFYPDLIQNSERVTLNELYYSPTTTTTENLNERIVGSELNREVEWKLQEESEITNISPTIIKRNSTNYTDSSQCSSKQKIRIITQNYFGNDYQPYNDHPKDTPSSSYTSSPLSSSPFTDEEHKFFIKTGNYSNEIILNQANDGLYDDINNVFNNYENSSSRKREIPKKYFKDQNLPKNRIKNPNYSKTKHINVSNQYY